METFKEAATLAADHGERLAAEGEICWAGMHSWKDMLDVLEAKFAEDPLTVELGEFGIFTIFHFDLWLRR